MDVEMPNGDIVEFPDDMPKEQIRAMILKKFPDAKKGAAKGKGYDLPGRIAKMGQDIVDVGHGALQSGAGLVGGLEAVGDLIGLPQGSRHAATREKLEKFAEAPSQSAAQSLGYGAAEAAPWLIPGPGWAAKALEWFGPKAATKILPTVAPSIRGAAGRFMQNPAHVARKALLDKIGGLGSSLGDVVERAAMGASVGALQDPEDPERGAGLGAVSPVVGPLAAKVAGKVGGGITGHIARGVTAGTVGAGLQALGVDPRAAYLIGGGSYFSPIGKLAHGVGAAPPRFAGTMLSKSPALLGAGVTSTARALSGRPDTDQP